LLQRDFGLGADIRFATVDNIHFISLSS
jgi:hypothetical protein